jgi:hypothetical protein
MRQTDNDRGRLMQIINEVPVPKIKKYFMQAVFGLLMYFIEHGDYDNFHNNFNYECGNTQEDINNYLLMKSSRGYTLKEIIDFHINKPQTQDMLKKIKQHFNRIVFAQLRFNIQNCNVELFEQS